MKKELICFFVLILFSFPGISAAIIYANSCSLKDVSAAIDSANDGDTIMVPAGTCVWSDLSYQGNYGALLHIRKGINLIGAGIGKTNIITDYNCSLSYPTTYCCVYFPSDFSKNNFFRISGFTFDFNNKCPGILLSSTKYDLTIQTRIRIDHNHFKDSPKQALTINGYRGVADNNIFTGIGYPIRFPSSSNDTAWWNNWEGIVFGKADNNFYFEDNIFEMNNVLVDCQYGNRYAFRYNNITASGGSSYPLMDMHGNQGKGYMYACFGGEIYGNVINMRAGQILDQRAGKVVLHHNTVNEATNSVWAVKVREEVWDEYNPTTNIQPQHISDSYYWNNRRNYSGNLLTSYLSQNDCSTSVSVDEPVCSEEIHGYSINENDEWYKDNVLFDGTSGIGCGTLSNRPSTCTPSVGYWVTNQSTINLEGMVGINPPTPISGTLYKCTSLEIWTPYYTPYIYPHPLRVAPSGTDICGEGIITNSCWCEGLKTSGYCYNGYYSTEEGERIEPPIIPPEEEQPPFGEVVTIQNMLNAYQRYKKNEVSILYFLDKLRNWIIFR